MEAFTIIVGAFQLCPICSLVDVMQSCVAAVISAYNSGSSIIRRIKAERQARRAPPLLAELERSVDQAPGEIEAEKQKGIARFGRAFEQGDSIAIIAVLQVTVEIQHSLLVKLESAANDDAVTDFTTLTDESDIGRNKTKVALYDLYQRLYLSSKSTGLPTPLALDNIPVHIVGRKNLLSDKEPSKPDLPSTSDVHNTAARSDENQQQQKRRLSRFKFGRKPKDRDQPERPSPTDENHSASINERRPLVSTTPSPQSVQMPTFIYEAGEDDPSRIWGEESESRITDRGICQSSAPQSVAIRIPTSENNFLGFCEAAWKLQYGDRKALKKVNWSQHTRLADYSFCCTKCPYYCRISEVPFWNKVWVVAQRGIKFRWPFLAKSHVPQKKRATPPDYSYLCQFCICSGSDAMPMKLEVLFDHISSEHRGVLLDEGVLERTKCVNDRICGDEEVFDINLWPLDTSEHSSFRRGSLASGWSSSSTGLV